MKLSAFFSVCLMVLGMSVCGFAGEGSQTIAPLAGTPMDYSVKSNWMVFTESSEARHSVDMFFLYPTSVPLSCKSVVGIPEAEMKRQARLSYVCSAECLADYTNAYAPYYRQISFVGFSQHKVDSDGVERLCHDSVVRPDVYAALDYFFKYVNKGKPYILAGHSQGSCNLKIALSEYMRHHPEYLKRMVACYAIGFYFPESWFNANPHVKKAIGETDTGVLISWNAEGPGATKPNLLIGEGSFNINPLNWRTDETPAGIDKNLGSLKVDVATMKKTVVPGKVSTRVDLKRGALICEGSTDYARFVELFGDKSFHMDDWGFFYQNIRENAQKRINAYFAK